MGKKSIAFHECLSKVHVCHKNCVGSLNIVSRISEIETDKKVFCKWIAPTMILLWVVRIHIFKNVNWIEPPKNKICSKLTHKNANEKYILPSRTIWINCWNIGMVFIYTKPVFSKENIQPTSEKRFVLTPSLLSIHRVLAVIGPLSGS